MKRLNVEGWIKLKWKHNVKMKIKCAMQNELIDDLAINYCLDPLLEQEQMRALITKGMKLSFKIDLKDVSWWMFIDFEHW